MAFTVMSTNIIWVPLGIRPVHYHRQGEQERFLTLFHRPKRLIRNDPKNRMPMHYGEHVFAARRGAARGGMARAAQVQGRDAMWANNLRGGVTPRALRSRAYWHA